MYSILAFWLNETAFGWAMFVLFSKDMGSVGSGRWFQKVDFCSKNDSIHIPSLFHATGRFQDDIASYTCAYNHIFFVMKYVIISCVISIACPFRSILHNMFSTVSDVFLG